jgi:hypothetical protein
MHKYYLRNKERVIERTNQWREMNKDKVIKYSKKYRTGLKVNALKAYSDNEVECACCGEKEIDFLCLDHIDNNGSQERKEKNYGLGTSFLKWLKVNNYPKNLRLQVLCFNCNMSKRIQNGVCIHQLIKANKNNHLKLIK